MGWEVGDASPDIERGGGGGTTAIGGRLEPSAVYTTHARTHARTQGDGTPWHIRPSRARRK